LPPDAPRLYSEHFEARREEHRRQFKAEHGRKPIPRHETEDYTPLNFFREVWGQYIQAGVISAKYLEGVDPELYRALVAFVRGSNEGRAGRSPKTLEGIGIRSQRDVMGRIGKPEP
jgi:hypothetical protein